MVLSSDIISVPLCSPDVVLIGEDNDDSGVWVLTQPANDLVELSGLWLTGNFHRLGDAQTSWIEDQGKKSLRNCMKGWIGSHRSRQFNTNVPLNTAFAAAFKCFLLEFNHINLTQSCGLFMVDAIVNLYKCNCSPREWCKVLKKNNVRPQEAIQRHGD